MEFQNIPEELLPSVRALSCQVVADIPGAPDPPRTSSVHHGETFVIPAPKWRDRNYYIGPIGWKADDLLKRAPDAEVQLTILSNAPAA